MLGRFGKLKYLSVFYSLICGTISHSITFRPFKFFNFTKQSSLVPKVESSPKKMLKKLTTGQSGLRSLKSIWSLWWLHHEIVFKCLFMQVGKSKNKSLKKPTFLST